MRGSWIIGLAAASLAQPASATWLEARTGHFAVYSEASEPALREFATRLERFDEGMRRLRNLPDRPEDRANPLIVYVVPDVSAVHRLCIGGANRERSRLCTNVAGFYQGHAEGSVAFTPRASGNGNPLDLDAQTVLFHEYSHHFMFENYSAAYPSWFVEGFAEFNSTASFAKDGSIGFGEPALHRYRGLLIGQTLPLTVMLTDDGRPLSPEQRESLYGRGWLLTHYLTFEPSRQGQLTAYLKAINDGKPSLDTAKAAFGDLGKLDRDLDAYLHRGRLKYVSLKPGEVPVGTVTIRPLTVGEAATMPVRMRSDRTVDATTAPLVAADARRLAAPFATDAAAQDELAEAEFDAGNDDAAEAAADRALAAAPADRTAMMYKGRVLARRAERGHVTDPAVWRQARGWFIRANKLETDNAEPLVLFYHSYLVDRI